MATAGEGCPNIIFSSSPTSGYLSCERLGAVGGMVLVCVGGGAVLPAAPPCVRICGAVDGPFGSGEGGGGVVAGGCQSACACCFWRTGCAGCPEVAGAAAEAVVVTTEPSARTARTMDCPFGLMRLVMSWVDAQAAELREKPALVEVIYILY